MGYDWKTRVSPLEKKNDGPGLKAWGKMGAGCSVRYLIQALHRGYEKCLRWTFCAGCGCRTTSGRMASSRGAHRTTFRLLLSSTRSPYDLDAHYSKKRTTSWVGYKVHLTETCEKESPHLITHGETTAAPVSDDARTATIHEGLKQKDLMPAQHLVDTGYVDAQLLHHSHE